MLLRETLLKKAQDKDSALASWALNFRQEMSLRVSFL